jgi:hypothetical protein
MTWVKTCSLWCFFFKSILGQPRLTLLTLDPGLDQRLKAWSELGVISMKKEFNWKEKNMSILKNSSWPLWPKTRGLVLVEFYKYDKMIELKRKGCNWTFTRILDQHFSLASINLSKYCFKVSSVYGFNFTKFTNTNSGSILEKCAWNIACMLF